MFASHWDLAKPKGVMKVKAVPSARAQGGRVGQRSRAALPGRLVLIAS